MILNEFKQSNIANNHKIQTTKHILLHPNMSMDMRSATERGDTQYILPASFKPDQPPLHQNCAPIENALANFPISMIWTFAKDTPTPDLLRSLATTLDVFPIICAAIEINDRGRVTMRLDNSNPVAFVEAKSPLRLDECMPSIAQRYTTNVAERQEIDCMALPRFLLLPVPDKCKGSQVYLQWTRLACGGAILGLSGYHFIDASSVGTFVSEWARQCRSLTSQAANNPSSSEKSTSSAAGISHEFDRAFMIQGMEDAMRSHPITDCVFMSAEELAKRRASSATAEASSSSPESSKTPSPIICRIYHFPRAELELIRQAASSPTSTSSSSAPSHSSSSATTTSISVHDALFAHLMQVICHATNTLSKEPVMICQAFNARRAFQKPDFFGSASFWLTDSKSATFASVVASLPESAQVVHHLHSSQTRDTLLAYNGHLASFANYADLNIAPRIMTHDLHVASWRHSGMYGVDFGRGACSYAGPGYFEGTRYLIFMDAAPVSGSEGEGGVDVQLALEQPQWEKMMRDGLLHRFAPNADHSSPEEEGQAESETEEYDMSQSTIDKYSNELNYALFTSDVASVERLCQLPAIRSYTPYHLTQLENVLSFGNLTGEAQERCWQAMSTAWPETIDANLAALMRAAVAGGPLSALTTLIQKVRERSVSSIIESFSNRITRYDTHLVPLVPLLWST